MNTVDFYPDIIWPEPLAFVTKNPKPLSDTFVRRLCRSYRHQITEFAGFGDSMWGAIAQKNRDVHEALSNSNYAEVARISGDPASTNLFAGFDNATTDNLSAIRCMDRAPNPADVGDRTVRLAEAVGALRLYYPEQTVAPRMHLDLEQVLNDIDARLNKKLQFPNPFPNEFGLKTSRGVISFRALQAVYQAWRITSLVPDGNVAEIGGGLGRTAYYAIAFGTKRYTLIDLPLSATSQATFLAHVFGEDALTLPGESDNKPLRIETPSWFLKAANRFDLVANFDSLVEMDHAHAEAYATAAMRQSSRFLSVNHEFSTFKVSDLGALYAIRKSRVPYWMRKGYAEEFFEAAPKARFLDRVFARLRR